jgi:DNA-binding beta-propeller fold protein YncE
MRLKKTLPQNGLIAMALIFSSLSLAVDYSIHTTMPSSGNDALRFDNNNNLYVSYSGDFGATGLSGTKVRKVAINGDISEHVTNLKGPLGTNFDSSGNMYIANYNTGEIDKITPSGEKTLFIDIGSAGFASGIAINSHDKIFVASFAGNAIYKVDLSGNKELWVKDARLNGPVGIVMDEAENIYVGNYNDGKVFKIDINKVITELASAPVGLGYITYAKDAIFGTGYNKNLIYKIPVDGSAIQVLEGSAEAGFKFPNGITTSTDGKKLYVSNYLNNKIILIENF